MTRNRTIIIIIVFAFINLIKCNQIEIERSKKNKVDTYAEILGMLNLYNSDLFNKLKEADSLYFKHMLTEAYDKFVVVETTNNMQIHFYVQFRINDIKQKLNLCSTNILISSIKPEITIENCNSFNDSIFYLMNDINIGNKNDISIFENLIKNSKIKPLHDYWKGKVYQILGEYYYFEMNDVYKAYENLNLALDYFESINIPVHEFIYVKKILIQLTIINREYLIGRSHGLDMIEIVTDHFNKDTLLAGLSWYMSGYIDEIASEDTIYIFKYERAITLLSKSSCSILYQQALYSYISSLRYRNDSTKLNDIKNELALSFEQGDTLINVHKLYCEDYFSKGDYYNCLKHADLALEYIKKLPRVSPGIYLTIISYKIDCFRNLNMFDESILESFNILNYKNEIIIQNIKDVLDGKADLGYFNFITIEGLALTYYNKYIITGQEELLFSASSLIKKAEFLADRENYSIEENRKLDLLNYTKHVYRTGMKIYFELYKIYNHNDYFNKFYYYQEKSKSSILSTEFMRNTAERSIPGNLIKRENDIRNNIRKRRMNTNRDSLIYFYSEMEKLNLIYKYKYPDYYNRLINSYVKPFDSIYIPMDFCYLSLSLMDSFIYILTKDISTKKLKKIYNNNLLYNLVLDITRNQMEGKIMDSTYLDLCGKMKKTEVFPLNISNARNFIICAEGSYYSLNYGALLNEDLNNYLSYSYNFYYTFNASLMDVNSIFDNNSSIVSFSYSDLKTIVNPDIKLTELPGGYLEALEIKKHSKLNKIFAGRRATIKNFVKAYSGSQCNHIFVAVHGNAFDDVREKVYLLFRNSAVQCCDTLFGYNILELKSTINEITLASCKSANGKYIDSEGMFNLVRYFKINGVKKINATFWNVKDNSFYKDDNFRKIKYFTFM